MKILIVDDEALVRKALRRASEAKSHQVVEAKDGTEGLKVWEEEKPDLVFLDVLMPGLSGPQVLEEMVDRFGAKVIMMSAYTGEKAGVPSNWPPVDLFLPKPFANIFSVIEQAEAIYSGQKA